MRAVFPEEAGGVVVLLFGVTRTSPGQDGVPEGQSGTREKRLTGCSDDHVGWSMARMGEE